MFDEFRDTAGATLASKVQERFGGTTTRIPVRPTPRLVDAIGDDAARDLCRVAGGETLAVPKGHRAALEARNRQIRAAAAAGARRNDLARDYKITDRQIRRIIRVHDS